jgi:fluoride exporter
MTPTVTVAVGLFANLPTAPESSEGEERLDKYLVVLTGAGLGGLARYLAGTWIMEKYGGRFPLGTFIINVTGSFLIGVLMTLLTERWQPHPNWRLFLVVGVLGGYTTFSSFEYETYQAARDGAPWIGLLYVTGSVILGYFGVWLGAVLASRG